MRDYGITCLFHNHSDQCTWSGFSARKWIHFIALYFIFISKDYEMLPYSRQFAKRN